jgi:DNA primase
VQLKKGGANYMGLCPFHNEKSPSFTVSPTKQFYHCFGCGAHGTSIGFLMEYSGLGYVDAIKELAQNIGMVVPDNEDRLPPARRAEAQAKSMALSEAMTRASDFYRQQLRTASQAVAYLQKRGLTGEIAARFGLGYAPPGWDNLRAAFPDYADNALVEAGLVIDKAAEEGGAPQKRYDRFRDRIMFPIRNTKGQVIAFGGRVMDSGEPKYLNSPETPLFQKGSELYGLFEARQAIRQAGYVLVTEGYMDVVALAQLGFPQAVATLGTACTPVHVQKLLRQTDHVVFSFDGDAAGRRAARRALDACLPHAGDSKTMKFLFLPDSDDPDSYVRQHGAAAFEELVNEAMPLSQFLLKEVMAEGELHTAEGRARVQFHAKPMLQAMAPSSLRLQLVRSLANATQTTPAEVEALFELSKPVAVAPQRAAPPKRGSRSAPEGLEKKVIRLVMAQPMLAAQIDDASLAALAHVSPDGGALLSQLITEARAMGDQANFAGLAERLRAAGPEFDALIGAIAADSEYDADSARMELAGAIRQTRLKLLNMEMEKLAASAMTPEMYVRYRELMAEREQLKQQAVTEAGGR